MLREIDHYFLQKNEPVKTCLQFLRSFILLFDKDITGVWRYKMSFYCYQGKRICYLWVEKKSNQPYIGIVDGDKINDDNLICESKK